ncbi:peptidase [Streptomyces nitrosporeus]|uniref:Peptidase n=1 Tax=Streptomyces nitrosporeus TaxID=28894 RepID=A0A5J6F486_9ACTN|nr:peptidase [Streptomyces nitrosporeus]QEU71051.1 peptidase [Streptomyces nitrosporeus]
MTHVLPGRRFPRAAAGVLAAGLLTGLTAFPAAAEEPDLGIASPGPVADARPGSAVGVPFSVLNKGTEEVGKVWVSYAVTSGLASAASYGNCLYSTVPSGDEEPERDVAVCAIDQPLKPGVLYVPEQPIGLEASDSALYDEVVMTVADSDSGRDEDTGETERVPGTGAPLKLVEKAPATDSDRAAHGERYAITEVTTANTADFALTGARIEGKAGDKVTATVKFVNEGPAWVYRKPGQGAATVDVRIPEGTSVVKGDGYCEPVTKTHYRCGTSQSWVHASDGEEYTFVLRIDKAVEGAAGKVSFGGEARPFDKNAANDTAEIVVGAGTGTGTTGGTASGGSASEGASSGGSTSGGSSSTGGTAASGGSAPQTGGDALAATGSGSTLPVLGGSAAVLAAGGVLLYTARRRAAAGR